MSLLKSFARVGFGITAFVLLGLTAVAQVEDDAVTVPVDFAIVATTTSTDFRNPGSVYLTSGSAVSASATGFNAGAFSTVGSLAKLRPGKPYTFTAYNIRISSLQVHFHPPSGYQVYIDRVERRRVDFVPDSGNTTVPVFVSFTVRIDDGSAAAFGQASSLRPNRITWDVGLGSLRNGKSAGAISLKETNLSTLIYSPTALFYDSDSNEIEVINGPGGALRQVYATNGLADITVDDPYRYRIKFYSRVSGAISSTKTNGVYTLTGTPVFEYVIENPDYNHSLGGDPNNPPPAPLTRLRISKITTQGGLSQTLWTEMSKGVGENYTIADWCEKVASEAAPASLAYQSWGYTTTGTTLQESFSLTPPGSTLPVIQTNKQYGNFAWGSELTSQTVGGVTSNYVYYTDPARVGAYRRLKSVTTSDGTWILYDYYDDLARCGEVKTINKPYLDSPSSPSAASASSGEVTNFDYAADWTGKSTLPSSITTSVNGVTTAYSTVAYTYENYTERSLGVDRAMTLLVATRRDYSSATSFLTTITKTFRDDADPDYHFFPGLLHSVQRPDGTMSVAIYLRGIYNPSFRSFTPVAGASEWMSLSYNGTTNSLGGVAQANSGASDQTEATEANFYVVPNHSDLSGVVHAADGMVVWTQRQVYTGGTWPVISRDISAYMEGYFLLGTSHDCGNPLVNWTVVLNDWTKGRLNSTTNEVGITQYFSYDVMNRVSSTQRAAATADSATIPALNTTIAYDAAGQVLSSTVGTTELVTTSSTYDTAGRLLTSTAPGGVTTTYLYNPTARTTTTTSPWGSTKVEQNYADGRLKSVTGTGVIAQFPSYAVQPDGTQYQAVRVGNSSALRKQEAFADWLGRPIKTSRPGFGANPTFDEVPTYDPITGQLTKSKRTGYGPMLYGYNTLGQVVRTGTDLDNNASLDLAGVDRVADADSYIENISGDFWLTSTNGTYPTPGSANFQLLGTVRQRLTGLTATLRSETRSTDAEGNVSTRTVQLGGATLVSVTSTSPGLINPQIERSVNGLTTSVTGVDGLTYRRNYDALTRLSAVVDPRTGTSTTTYITGTARPSVVKDAGGNLISTTTYDAFGRVSVVKDALNKTARYEYDSLGRVFRQWGSAVTPVSYVFDQFGQQIEMDTYQDRTGSINWDATTWPAASIAGDKTNWTFDDATGFLTRKTDAQGRYVEFTYNARGQTAARYWSRTYNGARVTCTYSYFGDTAGDPLTGELKGISYNDTTPGVTKTYTRLGQTDSVTDDSGVHDFIYDATKPWRLNAEALDTFYGSRVLTQTYEASTSTDTGDTSYTGHTIGSVLGRTNGYQLGTVGTPNGDFQMTYALSNVGRVAGYNSGRNAASVNRKFFYGYTANSNLVASMSIVGNAFMATRSYDPKRDLLTSIQSNWTGAPTRNLTRFDYTYDARRQRNTSLQSGEAFGDYGDSIHQIFNYNDRHELTSAGTYLGTTPTSTASPLSGRLHQFSYDAVGNRVSSNRGASGPVADTYQVNSLNQYTSRDNHTVAATGTADADATVAVSGTNLATPAGRAGRAWGDLVSVDNVNHPYFGTLSIFSARAGGGGAADLINTQLRTLLVPSDPQTFTYDADGNLLSDNLWDYQWDAENRLIRMETNSVARSFSVPWQILTFRYDSQGRRTEKKVVNGSNGQVTYFRRFVYAGWNMLAEIDAASSATKKLYTWGLDLAGSFTATGCVGALNEIYDVDLAKSLLPSYDGNGNVSALTNAASGVIEAIYEYTPFGELIRAEGSYATGNNYRFSTKYQDDETGLIYYGARYYDSRNGRFVGRDPIGESGGINLYGFCGNDGVNNHDYLGNSWFSKAFHALTKSANPLTPFRSTKNFLSPWLQDPGYYLFPKVYQKVYPTVAGAVVGIIVGVFSENPELGAAVGEAIANGESVLINGGSVRDAAKSAAVGAAVGYATAEISASILHGWEVEGKYGANIVGHGLVGGAASVAQGGSFRSGFWSSVASTGIGYTGVYNIGGNPLDRTLIAAGVGGSISKLTGGNFLAGAISSGIQWGYNEEKDNWGRQTARGKILFEAGPGYSGTDQESQMIQSARNFIAFLTTSQIDGSPTVTSIQINELLDAGQNLTIRVVELQRMVSDGIFKAGWYGEEANYTISFDPANGPPNYLGNGKYAPGSADSTLAHEISHAWDDRFRAEVIAAHGGNGDEATAVKIQNQIRYIQHESLITTYGRATVKNYNQLIPK